MTPSAEKTDDLWISRMNPRVALLLVSPCCFYPEDNEYFGELASI